MKQSYIDSFGADHPMRNKEIAMKSSSKHNYDDICKKASETYRNKTGYSNPFSDPEIHKEIMIKASEKRYDEPSSFRPGASCCRPALASLTRCLTSNKRPRPEMP